MTEEDNRNSFKGRDMAWRDRTSAKKASTRKKNQTIDSLAQMIELAQKCGPMEARIRARKILNEKEP